MLVLVGRAGRSGVWARRVRERERTEAVVRAKLHVYYTCDSDAAVKQLELLLCRVQVLAPEWC